MEVSFFSKRVLGLGLLVFTVVSFLLGGCSSTNNQTSSSDRQVAPDLSSKSNAGDVGTDAITGRGTRTVVSPLRQSSQGGNVTIDVTWENPTISENSTPVFDIGMNTHSVDLDGYDLSKLAVLRTDQGVVAYPDESDTPAGGHHRSGQLRFSRGKNGEPILGPKTRAIELIITDIAGIKERSFRWEISQ